MGCTEKGVALSGLLLGVERRWMDESGQRARTDLSARCPGPSIG